MLYTKYESSGPCTFRQEDFLKLHFENLFFDPVTYLCNQSGRKKQLWQRTSRWCYIPNMKALGLVVLDKKFFFKIAFWKPIFWPRDLLMQPFRTIWTISVRDHPGTIPVEFNQIPISGSREEVVCSFPYIIQCKIVTPGAGSILTPVQ